MIQCSFEIWLTTVTIWPNCLHSWSLLKNQLKYICWLVLKTVILSCLTLIRKSLEQAQWLCMRLKYCWNQHSEQPFHLLKNYLFDWFTIVRALLMWMLDYMVKHFCSIVCELRVYYLYIHFSALHCSNGLSWISAIKEH